MMPRLTGPEPNEALEPDAAIRLLEAMQRARQFDDLAVALQQQGVVAGYGQAGGQEAAQIGAVWAMHDDDMVFPSYRQPGVALHRGVSVRDMLRFYSRHEFCTWDWRACRFAPYAVPVGSQLAHAVGWAMADRARGGDQVTLAYFGDGSASQGEVHEAMNMAGVYRAPVVFLCENNGWAISTPFARQTAASTVYVRAEGYGFRGVRVDGNDVLAVAAAVRDAAVAARTGLGPSLIEAVTYRLGGHTTADDPSLYRSDHELEMWRHNDPIDRFARVCVSMGAMENDAVEAMRERILGEIRSAAAAFAEEFGV